MTAPEAPDSSDRLDWARLAKQLITDPLIVAITFLIAVLELGNAGILPALTASEKATEVSAQADNAALLQQSESALAEQKSITATAEAEYAPRIQLTKKRAMQANALRAAADAEIAAADAANSPVTKSADVDVQNAKAELDTQKGLIEKEKARQATRKLCAELEVKQIKLAQDKVGLMASKYQLNVQLFADPTYNIFPDSHYVPDLPSGAELPPLPDEPAAAPPPKPVIITTRVHTFP